MEKAAASRQRRRVKCKPECSGALFPSSQLLLASELELRIAESCESDMPTADEEMTFSGDHRAWCPISKGLVSKLHTTKRRCAATGGPEDVWWRD